MIPKKTIEELITKHSTLEKDLSSGNLDNKVFAEKSKEYSQCCKRHGARNNSTQATRGSRIDY